MVIVMIIWIIVMVIGMVIWRNAKVRGCDGCIDYIGKMLVIVGN